MTTRDEMLGLGAVCGAFVIAAAAVGEIHLFLSSVLIVFGPVVLMLLVSGMFGGGQQ